MAIRDRFATGLRSLADKFGPPAFAGTPFPEGTVADRAQLKEELGATGTFLFGGFIRSEDPNPEMDGQTAIKNYDMMRRSDSQVHAALEVVKLPIRTADYEIDPSDPNDPEALAYAKFAEWALFERMGTWDDLIRQALLMLDFGFMLFEKVWTVEEAGEYAGNIVLHKLASRPPKTIWQWFTDEDGALLSIKQLAVKAGSYQFLDIPSSKLVRFTFNQEGDNFLGISMLRSAYPHWLIKKNLYVIDAIRAQRYGVGIPRAKLKEGYRPTEEDKDAIATMLMGLSSHQHGYLIQPSQMEVDILVPQGTRGGVDIMSSVNHQNEQITRNILAQFLDMGGKSQGGSRALGASAMDFFLNAIESIATQICDVLNKQVIKDLIEMNFATEKFPRLRVAGIKEDDVQALCEAASKLAAGGFLTPDPKTENTFRTRLDLPQRPEAEIAAQQAAAGVPPGTAPPMGGDPATPATNVPMAAAPVTGQPMYAGTTATGVTPAAPATPYPVDAQFTPQAAAQAQQEPPVAYSPPNISMRPAVAPAPTQMPTDHGPALVANTTVTQSMPANYAGEERTMPATFGGAAALPTDAMQPAGAPTRSPETPTSVPSSGNADEEDHSSSGTRANGTDGAERSNVDLQQRRRQLSAAASPRTTFWREPTSREKAILSLAEIPQRLDTARSDCAAMLRSVREEQISRIASAVARAKPDATLKAPLVGKMASDLQKAMQEVYDYGFQQVRVELNRQQRGDAVVLADFDESKHPRDEHGKWTMFGTGGEHERAHGSTTDIPNAIKNAAKQAKTVTLYHGTVDAALRAIKRDGLVPAKGKGADEAAREAGSKVGAASNLRRPSVFMIGSPEPAAMFAAYAATINKAAPIVLEVKLPPTVAKLAKTDELFDDADNLAAVRFEQPIRPEWITRVGRPRAIYNVGGMPVTMPGDFTWRKFADSDGVTIYVVFFVSDNGGAALADWDPDLHPRDEAGKFAPSGSGGTAEQTARGAYAGAHAKTGGPDYDPGSRVDEPEVPGHLHRGSAGSIYEANLQTGDDFEKATPDEREKVALEANKQFKGLVDQSHVYAHPLTLRAAPIVRDVLSEMKAKGYEMPSILDVSLNMGTMPSGSTEFVTNKGTGTVHDKVVNILLPFNAPQDASPDDLAKIGFGGKTEAPVFVSERGADGKVTYHEERVDKFAVKSIRDTVIHEMGHVVAGYHGLKFFSELASDEWPPERAKAAARHVSDYASENANEFLAEAFTRKYRGEKLHPEAEALYQRLKGPKIR